MTRSEMIAAIDDEIKRLEKVRTLLRDKKDLAPRYERALTSDARPAKRAKRKMSAEGRRRIIEAQKRRWAKQKQQSSGKAKK